MPRGMARETPDFLRRAADHANEALAHPARVDECLPSVLDHRLSGLDAEAFNAWAGVMDPRDSSAANGKPIPGTHSVEDLLSTRPIYRLLTCRCASGRETDGTLYY